MAPNSTWTTHLRRLIFFPLFFVAHAAFAFDANAEFLPPSPISEYLPAQPGEPPIDFCSEWNPEFGYGSFRCCSKTGSRTVATGRKGRRRRVVNACAPNRTKWQFCDDMTDAQRDYVAAVKSGEIDPLDYIQRTMGSQGGQAFCGVSNGFLFEGRPLVPTAENRIEIRNEARCTNYGTSPLIGAFEWLGREIKREFHEPEFERARLIVGDLAAPRGGCISGRGGRRAHKSHTGGTDIDFTFFNPRASHPPEERFTRTFYVASNWWMLKKLFKNPFACVKIAFLDRSHIRQLERYAKDDPEWAKLKRFIRHVRGHRDHFHVRVGSGPGVPGCASDPNLEEDEDQGLEGEGYFVKEDENPAEPIGAEETTVADKTEVESDEGDGALAADSPLHTLASPVQMPVTTLPPHKLEPAISMKFAEKPRRRKKRSAVNRTRKQR